MLFQRINRTDPEKVFLIGKAAAAISKGCVVRWDASGTDDGLAINVMSATTAALVVGLADAAIASGDYGLVQVYGMDDDAVCRRAGTVTNSSHVIGDILDIWSASSGLSGCKLGAAVLNSASDAAYPMFVIMQTLLSGNASSNSTTTAKVFIRAL